MSLKGLKTMKSILTRRRLRQKYNKKYYARTRGYDKREWTDEEDVMVLEHDITDTELSKILERSVAAIQTRRCILKRKGK